MQRASSNLPQRLEALLSFTPNSIADSRGSRLDCLLIHGHGWVFEEAILEKDDENEASSHCCSFLRAMFSLLL